MVQLKVPSVLLPEFLGVVGIDVFLVLSILTCLFDFPVFLQYVYHVSAFMGLGQLWIGYAFAFGEEIRFLICVAYLFIALANVVFVNGFVGFRDRKMLQTVSLLFGVTIPSLFISFSAMSWYVNQVAISLPSIPLISPGAIVLILVLCGAILVASLVFSVSGTQAWTHGFSVTKKRGGGKRHENKR